MSISFNTIPATIRTGGVFTEYSNSQATAGLLAQMPNTNLIIGQRRKSAGTVAQNILTAIPSAAAAQTYWGQGSVIANMADAWFDMNPYLPLYGIGVDADDTGAAAVGTFVFTGPATAAGTIYALVAGKRISCSVGSTDSANTIATSLYNAINTYAAASNLPVVATNGTPGTTTVTAIEKGIHGNSIDLRLNYDQGNSLPAGVGCTVTTCAGGTGTISLTNAIAAMGAMWFTTVAVWLSSTQVTTNIAALEAAMLTNWGPMVMHDGQIYYAGIGTKTNHETDTTGHNSPFSTFMGGGLSPTPPWVWATQAAAVDAMTSDAGKPRSGVLLIDCLPPGPGLSFVWTDRNTMLGEGISTYTVVNGSCYTERLITTYQKATSGAADISYMSIETMRVLAYQRYTWDTLVNLTYPQYKLAADGTSFDPAQKIVTPSRLSSLAVNWYESMIQAGLAQNKAAFVASLKGMVQLNGSDPNRVDLVMSPHLIAQFNTLASQVAFVLGG